MTSEALASAKPPHRGGRDVAGAWGLTRAVLRELGRSRTGRARFLWRALVHRSLLRRYAACAAAVPPSALGAYLRERPEVCGALLWPYQCAAWSAPQRLARIESHFSVLDAAPERFRFATSDSLLLVDLGAYREGARLVLDQPKWLYREGLFALNIFLGEHRVYSLSFSLHRDDAGIALFVGGLQGRRTACALDDYRHLTQDFHGMRPRDLLIDMLKALAPVLGATRIQAVADEHRYFRHRYFGCNPRPEILSDYNAIWSEREGRRVAQTHFELPLAPSIRCLDDVPSRKRAAYRRRNEMLASLFERIRDGAESRLLRAGVADGVAARGAQGRAPAAAGPTAPRRAEPARS